jgi:hypothetical protein
MCCHQQHLREDQEEISEQLILALPMDDPSCGWKANEGTCLPHQWKIE